MPLAAVAVQQFQRVGGVLDRLEGLVVDLLECPPPQRRQRLVAGLGGGFGGPDDGVDNPARVSAELRRMVVSSFPSGAPIARGRIANSASFRGDCAGRGKWFRSGANCFAARRIVSR